MTDQVNEHEVIGVDLAEPNQNPTGAVAPPEIKFIKKTWRHRLQELNLRKNIVALMSRQQNILFKLVPLAEDDKLWLSHYDENQIAILYPHRCRMCLDPAVHKVLCATDASFTSYRCDNNRCKSK